MKHTLKTLLISSVLPIMAVLAPHAHAASANSIDQNVADYHNLQGLNPQALKMGLKAYNFAEQHSQVKKPYLAIADYTQPSNQKRFYIVDTNTHQVLYKIHVAHGMNSGGRYATQFSNSSHSHETSLGVYTTDSTYSGKHGVSLRLSGLEQSNSNAYSRSVVMHSAPYMTDSFIKSHNMAGRSWGCFAMNPKVAPTVINQLKGGSVIFAYAKAENHDTNLTAS